MQVTWWMPSSFIGTHSAEDRIVTEMNCDVAVLGGGPGGYTAAIRAAQLGASVVCVESEPELGGTCLRVGCIPTKAWVETAHWLHAARDSFPKLGVSVQEPRLDFAVANEWKAAVVAQMTGGVASLFKANGVEWVKGKGAFRDANTLAVEGGEDITFTSAIVATGSFPILPPIAGLDSELCVDSTGLLAQTEVPRRLAILGGGIIGCEFASIFNTFGSEVTVDRDARPPDPAGGRGRVEGARQGSSASRGSHSSSASSAPRSRRSTPALVVRYGDGESVEADLMLVAVGRAPLVSGIGLEAAGVSFDTRKGVAADDHRRTSVPHIYAVGDCAGYWQLAHTAFREGEVAAENACGHDAVVDNRAVPRPDLHPIPRSRASA